MPHVEIPQAEFKVVFLGDSSIGKTSLVTRFAEGYYRENSRPATVGAFFVTKRIQSSDSVPTKIQIWDTAGQDDFRAMAPVFYRNAAAVVVCYDASRRESFEGMRRWLDEVRRNTKRGQGMEEEVVVAIAALKSDLLQEDGNNNNNNNNNGGARAAVPEHEVEQLAETLGVLYLPTSAKTNRNVDALFQCIADRVLQVRSNGHGGSAGTTPNGEGAAMNGGAPPQGGCDDGYTNNNNNNNNNNSAVQDEGMQQMISPRRRDQFDKYYVSQNGNRDDEKEISSSARSERSRGSTVRRGSTGTEETSSHPFLANGGDNGDAKDWNDGPKEEEGMRAVDEAVGSYMTCQCGAADGGYGCAVQ